MTHTYDRDKTFEYFQRLAEVYDNYSDENNLHARDRILIEKVFPKINGENQRIIDYGCGAGHLLAALAKKGHSVMGFEPGEALCQRASKRFEKLGLSPALVQQGGLELLPNVPPATTDLFLAMGVFQYISDDEYRQTLAEIKRILRPGGHLVCTYQNGLFDMFTFNKYTIDFIGNHLFPALEKCGLDAEKATESLKTLLANPTKPAFSEQRARDSIYVRLGNPLLIKDELSENGFGVEDLYFYEFQPVPPLIAQSVGVEIKEVGKKLEVEHSQEWFGYFTGSAFLTHCTSL